MVTTWDLLGHSLGTTCSLPGHCLGTVQALLGNYLGKTLGLLGHYWWSGSRAHICHEYHNYICEEKICHVEKFQLSILNLNNLWNFIEVFAVFVSNLCGEKSVRRKSLWRKNDKYEVCSELIWILATPLANIQTDKILQS